MKALDNTIWYTQVSHAFANGNHIHFRCLGLTHDCATPHLKCRCGAQAGPSGETSAHRQATQAAWQQHAIKRAREEPDPFA